MLLVVALLACVPVAAEASTASSAPDIFGVKVLNVTEDAAGEVNNISMSSTADGLQYLVEDLAADITANAGCTPVDSHHVFCDAADVRGVSIMLGNGDDQLTIGNLAYPADPPTGQPPLFADGGVGADRLKGGAGPDLLFGASGDDPVISGGGGDDNMSGGGGDDMMVGGTGAERSMAGGPGSDTIWGGDGNDSGLTGQEGVDKVDGDAGNDDVRGNEGGDMIRGGTGDDRLDFARETEADPTSGEDTLEGGPGDDKLNAGPAIAADIGSQERDILSGGDGTDRADFRERTAPLTIDLDGSANDGESDERDNVQPDVECVIGGSNGDTLIGSSAANCIDGAGGEDSIDGRGGDDELKGGDSDPSGDNLRGGSGSDAMSGGPGDDWLAGGEDGDVELGGGGGDRVEGESGNDRLAGGGGVDRVDGGGGNDLLIGGGVSLTGGDASDELLGGRGADRLLGGQGNDRLDGGRGADYISGEGDRDTVTYEDRTNRVFVTLDGEDNDGEAGEHDNVLPDVEVILAGIRGDNLSGDRDRDTVAGESGQDLIRGNPGDDQLFGGDAADIVMARDGDPDDEVVCGADGDLAIADEGDKVIECPTVDRPGDRRPIVGREALVRPEGRFRLRLPQGPRFFGLKQKELTIPIGSTVDPKADVVRLVTARNRTGARQVASVRAGRFTVRQRGRRRPVTELRLAGRLPDCPRSSTRRGRAKRAARSSPRRLRVAVGKSVAAPKISNRAGVSVARRKGNRPGGTKVRGRYSLAAAYGTAWLTEDTCDGTLTTVIRGTVLVRDFGRGRTERVRSGKRYLARAE